MMLFDFLNRQIFDALVLIVFGIGVLAAAFRLYKDFTRPLDDEHDSADDTQPRPPRN